ncbi:MAG: hypothetical protein AB7K67_01110 [Hyphomicrobiaceae bacterium]
MASTDSAGAEPAGGRRDAPQDTYLTGSPVLSFDPAVVGDNGEWTPVPMAVFFQQIEAVAKLGTTSGRTYTDAKGRILLCPPEGPRHVLAPFEAASAFVGWIRDEGVAAGEWEWVQDIVESFEHWCAWERVEPIPSNVLLDALKRVPGVRHGRHRLGEPQFAHARSRARSERAIVYRIATDWEMAEAARELAEARAVPAHERSSARAAPRVRNRPAAPLPDTPIEIAIREAA